MNLAGYDWEPAGVDLATNGDPQMKRCCTDSQGFRWQQGASYVAKRLLTCEHALHCPEIMIACRESSRMGKYIDMQTTFDWPVIKS